MVKIYIELTARKIGLTQVGYYKPGSSFVSKDSIISIPFTLTDKDFAPSFDYGSALKQSNKILETLNFGYYKSISVDFLEVQDEKV